MARKKFLIVTADPERGRVLGGLLSEGESTATVLASEPEAVAELGRRLHQAVFLDADNPALPGLALCRRLRGLLPAGACAIVLFGSPRGGAKLVESLDEGADDFWPYPFNAPVCRAYLRAILRRVSRLGGSGPALKSGDLQVDPVRRKAFLGDKEVSLRSKEFDLLYLLLNRRGEVLSREFLMEEAWGREYFGTTRTIDFHVSRLRRKLGRKGKAIETIARGGYRFSEA